MFEGSSLVDRVVEKSPERYSTREQATELLQGVLKEGFIKSIGRSRLFEDGSQLFYWTENSQSPNNMATTVNSRTQVTSLLRCNHIIISRLWLTMTPPPPLSVHRTPPMPIKRQPVRIIQISVKVLLVSFYSLLTTGKSQTGWLIANFNFRSWPVKNAPQMGDWNFNNFLIFLICF